jgi:hypothetical protein
MTGDEAAFLARPDLPDAFERWELELPARTIRPTSPDEWAGALARIESGTLEVGCQEGGHETFRAGDMIALGWLPIVELRNHGNEPVRVLAVRRRGTRTTDSYLHVTRPDA